MAGVQAARKAIEDAMRPGPISDLLDRLNECVAVTRRPEDLDEVHLVGWMKGISQALMDYPGDIAARALRDWRKTKNGEYWPREKPLRDLCEEMVLTRRTLLAAVNMQEHAAKEAPKGRYMTPFGRSQLFFDACCKVIGADWANAWMRGGVNCQWDETTLYTTKAGEMMIRERASGLAKKYDVQIVADANASKLLENYCKDLPSFTPTSKKKKFSASRDHFMD
jgi:hypothetical protein